MNTRYDRDADVLHIELAAVPAAPARETLREGLVLLLDAEQRIVALELHAASQNLPPDVLGTGRTEHASDAPARRRHSRPSGRPTVTIFSDGACSGNPGPGGWAARLRFADGRLVELGGAEGGTTNNRMELLAAINGLEAAGEQASITVVTDSEYLRKGITEWIHGWKRRGWLTAAKKPVLNQDLWRRLDQLNGRHVKWEYTRGHAGDPDNERCDEIAQTFARGGTPALRRD